jgi:bifunctional UDP-N-acetylglucosamine pyrophosphorylase/glucosamine-1-phosphate N-acetyltransferase
MTHTQVAAIVLAAGKGTRMKSETHKVLHSIAGRPMLLHLLATLDHFKPKHTVVVVGSGRDQVEAAVTGKAQIAVQEPQLGTGHAVMAARKALTGFNGDVLILYGDVPMLSEQTMKDMLAARHARKDGGDAPAIVVLGFRPKDPGAYGRLVLGPDGDLKAIVEYKDATTTERAIGLCNSGIMAVDGRYLFDLLDDVDNDNAGGEYYLTDIVGLARDRQFGCVVVEATEEEVMGINSRAELSQAEAVFQRRRRAEAMTEGVTLIDPDTVFFSHDTVMGRDVTIEPNVFFGPGVKLGDKVKILGFSHIEGATVGDGAIIGPFARLRPGADIGVGAKVGNFVEIKKAKLEAGAKVNHLSYIGDARVGAKANVGAGTITCNYDGFNKHFTDIGAGAFIGSNTALVAPVKIGEGAIIGAGSVITKDVTADALGVVRAEQREIGGWAAKFRQKQPKK